VTISTRTTDRSHFLIFSNTYEAALYFPQICDVILRSSATHLQINRRVFKMGRKSKELSEDRKQLVVDLKREGHRNCCVNNAV
jgi:hypothetical protein